MYVTQDMRDRAEQQAEEEMDQFISFMLADEEYGIDILRVQEIRVWSGVTQMPNTPEHILGVINLRGTIVPIIDLRKFLQIQRVGFDRTTVVIIVRVEGYEGDVRTMGIVVDAVSEVFSLVKQDIKPAPSFGGALNVESIKGLAMVNDKMVIIIDVDHLICNDVMNALVEIE